MPSMSLRIDAKRRVLPPRGEMPDFNVSRRNPHHWDVSAVGVGRAFAIRGEPGDVIVRDEREDASRPHPRPVLRFKSVAIAMAWIADELMQEPQP